MQVPRILVPLIIAFAVLAFVASGCTQASASTEFDALKEVTENLNESYIHKDKLDQDALNRAAIRGIMEYLDDPYTSYLLPEQYEAWSASLSGEEAPFEGIGAQVTVRGGDIIILGPLPESPASRAGIRAGDVVLGVNGVSVAGMELLEAVALIRGPQGTEVTLRISRADEVRPVEITVVRDEIELRSVSSRIHAAGIGVVHLESFDAKTVENLQADLASLRAEGVEGIILDLRFNSGGLVDAAVGVASEFIESGTVFIWQEADGEEQLYTVDEEGSAYDIPLVVVTNGFTASAAEIVAGALQDHERATVVGSRTFGKGSVNLMTSLATGAGMSITTARWLTPDGRVIEGNGLVPDIAVPSPFDLEHTSRVGTLARSLCEAHAEDPEAADGEQLSAAIEDLCSIDIGPSGPVQSDEQLDVAVATLRERMESAE